MKGRRNVVPWSDYVGIMSMTIATACKAAALAYASDGADAKRVRDYSRAKVMATAAEISRLCAESIVYEMDGGE
jgi:hypothetical protein